MREQVKTAILMLFLLTLITGIAYPLFITAIAQSSFRYQANGSLIVRAGKTVGSSLIGQSFDDPRYLWGRLSATSQTQYNAAASSGSNLGPSNPVLIKTAKSRIEVLRSAEPGNAIPIPVDLVTSSASGLDPHISLEGAYYQVSRIAKRRGIPEDAVKEIVRRHAKGRFLGFMGEPIVNVLGVNLDLDSYKK
jgi:K+-transporting ATPase ATPase C chain